MADSASRIEQFKKMANDDPNNELGHFSLGRAYLDANNFTESAASLQRCLAINPKLSKAYQLLATAMLKLGQKDQAIAQLTAGAKIAHERGDVMPKNDMLKQLGELGAPVPELKSTEAEKPVGEGTSFSASAAAKSPPRLPSPRRFPTPRDRKFRQDLRRLLARMDRHGHQSDQRTAAAAERPAGAEALRSAHDGVSEFEMSERFIPRKSGVQSRLAARRSRASSRMLDESVYVRNAPGG
jgi:tetratricopeptide (TPR) repeat protein